MNTHPVMWLREEELYGGTDGTAHLYLYMYSQIIDGVRMFPMLVPGYVATVDRSSGDIRACPAAPLSPQAG